MILSFIYLYCSLAQSVFAETPSIDSGLVDTLMDGILDSRDHWLGNDRPSFASLHFKSDVSVKDADLPVTVEWTLHPTPAKEMVVFVTGIFGDPSHGIYLGHVKHLYDLGYDVLSIPNPWSEISVHANLHFSPGENESEADYTYHLILAAFKQLHRDLHAQKVHLFGLSYGGFLSSMVMSRVMKDHAWTGNLLIAGPPLVLSDSMKLLDHLKAQAALHPQCHFYALLKDLIISQWTAEKSSDLSPQMQACAGELMVQLAFYPSLENLVEWKGGSQKFTGTFESYIRNFTHLPEHESEIRLAERDSLEFHLKELESKGFSHFYLVSAWNDPFNAYPQWFKISEHHPLWDLHFYSEGGHLGFWRTTPYWNWVSSRLKSE